MNRTPQTRKVSFFVVFYVDSWSRRRDQLERGRRQDESGSDESGSDESGSE